MLLYFYNNFIGCPFIIYILLMKKHSLYTMYSYESVCKAIDKVDSRESVKDFFLRVEYVAVDMIRVLELTDVNDRAYGLSCVLINHYIWSPFIQDPKYYLYDNDAVQGDPVLKQKITSIPDVSETSKKSMLECFEVFGKLLFGMLLLTENDPGTPENQHETVKEQIANLGKVAREI